MQTSDPDEGYQMYNTNDSGALVISVSTLSNAPTNVTPSVSRFDVNGALMWTRSYYIEVLPTQGMSIVEMELDDAFDIMWTVGAQSSLFATSEGLVVRTDANGNLFWAQRLLCPLDFNLLDKCSETA